VFRPILDRLTGGRQQRTSGRPPSGNGASSFHLYWDVPPEPLAEVSATIEVIEPPAVDKLYFWAVQVGFDREGQRQGAAHFGLQHHPSYPGAGAVNWGGYRHGGGELDGSTSALPSTLENRNTRDYRWQPHRRYRYRIARSPEQGWRGWITDPVSGEEVAVRDLLVDAGALTSPMVWTEAFADCGDPPAAVRWTDLEVLTAQGRLHRVEAVRVNYQRYPDGGCTNTDSSVDGSGFVQRTAVERVAATGSTLRLTPSR
jgi:hypothetical protein